MTNGRVVLGATGADETLSTLARMLRDAGHEVVFVGEHQSAEQLVRSALAEDAAELVVGGDDADLAGIDEMRRELGAGDVVLTSAAEALGRGVTNPTPPNDS